MTPLTLLILFFGLAFILVGFGLMLGYLIFGRRKETVNETVNRTVIVERDNNLLGTAAAVAGGVIAGELIADAIEDVIEDEDNRKDMKEGEDITETADAFDDTDDLDNLTDF
ncbi:conserved hypothetical protein [Methanocaldococcus sp. FS406-22]|uniref:hypothetical protein n=1 Tax=Methanocaldococcus sp. (strain FS406-22) TaxID=644281 RepID=UPI0001C4E17C|nr:hypothetical protein [Methanocaldococcus sp. FS406-22]ADC69574.1 conserved hypothetical protein [Methanocaldococcus sp. FS406-22]